MKKICKNCQYYRNYETAPNTIKWPLTGMSSEYNLNWCSNSKSDKWRSGVFPEETCPDFYQRGKKAPLWMRALEKAIKK